MLDAGCTAEEVGEAFDEARRARYTQATGLGRTALPRTGESAVLEIEARTRRHSGSLFLPEKLRTSTTNPPTRGTANRAKKGIIALTSTSKVSVRNSSTKTDPVNSHFPPAPGFNRG